MLYSCNLFLRAECVLEDGTVPPNRVLIAASRCVEMLFIGTGKGGVILKTAEVARLCDRGSLLDQGAGV